jgi:hypothetical protein
MQPKTIYDAHGYEKGLLILRSLLKVAAKRSLQVSAELLHYHAFSFTAPISLSFNINSFIVQIWTPRETLLHVVLAIIILVTVPGMSGLSTLHHTFSCA